VPFQMTRALDAGIVDTLFRPIPTQRKESQPSATAKRLRLIAQGCEATLGLDGADYFLNPNRGCAIATSCWFSSWRNPVRGTGQLRCAANPG